MDSSFDFGALLKRHKAKPKHLSNMAEGVQRRLTSVLQNARLLRKSVFDRVRNLPVAPSPPPKNTAQQKMEQRMLQLQKWKEDKEKRKKEEAAKKKRPFVAGIPHAPLTYVPLPPPRAMPSMSGRVTRSQTARNAVKPVKETKSSKTLSFAPKNAGFHPKLDLPKYDLTIKPNKKEKVSTITFDPVLPKVKNTMEKSELDIKKSTTESTLKPHKGKNENKKAKDVSPAPAPKTKTPIKTSKRISKTVTPKNPIPKSESSSEERLRSPRSPQDEVVTPVQSPDVQEISPCVTMSRGKDNARKEMKKKLVEGLLDEDTCKTGSVDAFRRQLKSEIERLTELCTTWDGILEQTQLPELVQELVLGAVGQGRLLMSQKMQQFASLVQRCHQPEPGQALVTCADLQGFWDMLLMQVDNVDMRFKKLEEYRARGWSEEQPLETTKAAKPKPPKPKPTKATAKAQPRPVNSRLREMIAAARKAKKEEEEECESRSFEGGFFSVRSPLRSPAQASATPSKPTLLKAVLSNEAKKSASKSCSFAILRASSLAKNMDMDMEGIAPLEQTPMKPIDLNATPGRSILKSEAKAKARPKANRSVKVLFDDSDLEKRDEVADSGVSSMDTDEKENKQRPKLSRQSATEQSSPQSVLTRARRRSMLTPRDDQEPRRSARRQKPALHDHHDHHNHHDDHGLDKQPDTPRRSRRSKALQEFEVTEETPIRSSRRRRSVKSEA